MNNSKSPAAAAMGNITLHGTAGASATAAAHGTITVHGSAGNPAPTANNDEPTPTADSPGGGTPAPSE